MTKSWEQQHAFLANRVDGVADLLVVEIDELRDLNVIDGDLGFVDRPKYYPYAPYRGRFRGAQGIYLTRLSTGLTEAFHELVDLAWPAVEGPPTPEEISHRAQAAALEFSEGERSQRESAFFRRNPGLREEAIKRLGVRCVVCRLDFGERYGPAGKGYIEVHHLNPLAERKDTIASTPIMTKLDEVVPLCANCHRVIHRRRPAMTIAELKASFREA